MQAKVFRTISLLKEFGYNPMLKKSKELKT